MLDHFDFLYVNTPPKLYLIPSDLVECSQEVTAIPKVSEMNLQHLKYRSLIVKFF